jgi:hypothetical protein
MKWSRRHDRAWWKWVHFVNVRVGRVECAKMQHKVQMKLFKFRVHPSTIKWHQETMKLSNADLKIIIMHNPKILIIEDDEISNIDPMIMDKIKVKAWWHCSNLKLMFF